MTSEVGRPLLIQDSQNHSYQTLLAQDTLVGTNKAQLKNDQNALLMYIVTSQA